MALRFMDAFDSYVTADILKKWTALFNSPAITAGSGRRATAALVCSANTTFVGLTLDAQAIWTAGFAFRFGTIPSGDAPIMSFRDGTTTQVDLSITTARTLRAKRGGTATLATTTAALTLDAMHYIEIRVRFHGTLGELDIRIDGVADTALTTLNTLQTANVSADNVRFGNLTTTFAGVVRYDDLYLCDGSGSAPHNTLLGDCRVDTLLPSADGTAQQWTPSTPGTHYTLVDEASPNTTDYVSSSTIGHRDTYGMQDLTALTGTIYGVQLSLAALKSDAGTRSLKPLIVSGASEALGTATVLSTSQTYMRHVQSTDPATAAVWSEAGINAAQCGAEVA